MDSLPWTTRKCMWKAVGDCPRQKKKIQEGQKSECWDISKEPPRLSNLMLGCCSVCDIIQWRVVVRPLATSETTSFMKCVFRYFTCSFNPVPNPSLCRMMCSGTLESCFHVHLLIGGKFLCSPKICV